ncbi:hypothetical protein [Thermomonospora umbrina]|uniref:Uncharacterized protein n=1 Tax=Thermomonospora umbrina TaxID=111806 RepID=A0A3D9SWN3_9ACTN|nr:hypothetical protein [Thermomonospora umbrina]REF00347.1 hypothetical protein DFJ69_5879 [Thermomonospora umbrina]
MEDLTNNCAWTDRTVSTATADYTNLGPAGRDHQTRPGDHLLVWAHNLSPRRSGGAAIVVGTVAVQAGLSIRFTDGSTVDLPRTRLLERRTH